MKFSKAILTAAVIAIATQSANGASPTKNGFPPGYASSVDCSVSAKVLDATYREFFEGHQNIFEGTVLSTGRKPYGSGRIVNQCWTTVRVDKWYRTSLNMNEIPVLFETELKRGTGKKPDEPIQCPVTTGDSLLFFAGEMIDEKVDSIYMSPCSYYVPSQYAAYLKILLSKWKNAQK